MPIPCPSIQKQAQCPPFPAASSVPSPQSILLVFGSHAHVLVIGNSAGRLSCRRFSLWSWIHSLVEAAWSSVVPVTNDTPIRLFSRHHICQTNVDRTCMQRSTLLVLWASEGQFELEKRGIETLYNTHPITQGKPNKFIWQKNMGMLLIKEAPATGLLLLDREIRCLEVWSFVYFFLVKFN